MSEPIEPDDEIITCWCGEQGTYVELFDGEVYERTCHGTGSITCRCGGDFCVCHHHGEVECDGCEDCERDDFDDENEAWDRYFAEQESGDES